MLVVLFLQKYAIFLRSFKARFFTSAPPINPVRNYKLRPTISIFARYLIHFEEIHLLQFFDRRCQLCAAIYSSSTIKREEKGEGSFRSSWPPSKREAPFFFTVAASNSSFPLFYFPSVLSWTGNPSTSSFQGKETGGLTRQVWHPVYCIPS